MNFVLNYITYLLNISTSNELKRKIENFSLVTL